MSAASSVRRNSDSRLRWRAWTTVLGCATDGSEAGSPTSGANEPEFVIGTSPAW